MKLPVAALLFAAAALLVGAAATPVPVPDSPPAPVPSPGADADSDADYTTRMSEPALVPEYDPATAPPPLYAEPSDDDGLRQCVGADGVPIFTDRRCSDFGATPQQAQPAPGGAVGGAGSRVRVRSCARNQDDLLAGVRAALESHDPNRLADYYHWTGMGNAEGYRLMDRLDHFSARQVVDVQLVRGAMLDEYGYANPVPDAPPPPMPEPEAGGIDPADPTEAAPPPRRRPHAFLLRVDQMRGEKDFASTVTYFHLLTNAGCWWMRF